MPYLDQKPLSPIDRAFLKLAGISRAQPRIVKPTSAKTAAERREHPRRDGSTQVAMSFGVMDLTDTAWKLRSTPHRGHLVDLSLRGCAFHSRLPAPPGSGVALRLADDEFDDGRVLHATILRCDKRLGDEHRIVCRFDQNLSLDDLYQFGRHSFSHDVV